MGKGENTKKVAGNAKKAEAAAAKQAAKDAELARNEDAKWSQGAKNSAKKEAAADKAAEAARKKAEKAALLAEEEASMPKTQKPNKSAVKKGPSKGTLDLGKLDALGGGGGGDGKLSALNASGIDNALDALSLANSSGANDKIDRHPERRFKAAYTVFEERRLEELKDDKGLRRQQKIEQIRKEFEKSPENPFNQALAGRYDMSKEEMQQMREKEREAMENRLTSN